MKPAAKSFLLFLTAAAFFSCEKNTVSQPQNAQIAVPADTAQTQAADIPENPQVREIKWEPEIVYYGDPAKLLLKTFEFDAFTDGVILKLVDRENNIRVHEEELTASGDETEISINIEISDETAEKLGGKKQFDLFAEFASAIPIKKQKKETPLHFRIRGLF